MGPYGIRRQGRVGPAAVGAIIAPLVLAQPLTPAAATAPPHEAVIGSTPNIILLYADDLGYGDVGFNGQEHILTPNLDRMAAEGVVLTSFYACGTVCMPSRASMLTGKHTGHSPIRANPRFHENNHPISLGESDVTIAEELKRADYATGAFGKWGLSEPDRDRGFWGWLGGWFEDKDAIAAESMAGMPTRQGFDRFVGFRTHAEAFVYYPEKLWYGDEEVALAGNDAQARRGRYSHDVLLDEAITFIEGQAENPEPFFVYLPFQIPHFELTAPEEAKARYADVELPRRDKGPMHSYNSEDELNLPFAAMITHMDAGIGRLREVLVELGLDENTLIVFSSDNGPIFERIDGFFNSNGPFRGGKRDLYEGGIRVPFVAVWPGTVPAGVRSDHPAAQDDLLPTFAALAGVEPQDPEVTGISILPLLLGREDEQPAREALYWEHRDHRTGFMQAVRFDDWKLIYFHGDDRAELYNLEEDPDESDNLAGRHPDLVKQGRALMIEMRTDNPHFPLD